ncbi:internal virion protein A [Pectobacterium phage Q19]|uniref:Internal virion protein A n=1 Tax=Pectobacterium phage Q19 TaxID=2500576 RepID=A0A678ZRY7_9CAUD|nr:internal virion protein A [Pectobacterium phage Q19]
MVHIRPTTKADIETFQPHRDDLLEAKAAGHGVCFPIPEECVSMVHTWSGKVLAIGGNVGDQVWFVTSYLVSRLSRGERKAFRECILKYRNEMLAQYPTLWNYVWVGNTSHIRFLKTIGAVFENDFTLNGQFQLFTIRR